MLTKQAAAGSVAPMTAARPAPRLFPNPTRPYWLTGLGPVQAPRGATQHLSPSSSADVVIIGGGISGVSTAYHLLKAHPTMRVVLVEGRALSHGATGRNGGLLWPALNAPWLRTVERFGLAEACRIMHFELACIREVTDYITGNALQDSVRYSPFRDGAMHLFDSEAELSEELAELELMQAQGFHTGCRLLDARQASAALRIPPGASGPPGSGASSPYVGAVQQPEVARVWAARLVHVIAAAAADAAPPGHFTLLEGCSVEAVGAPGETAAAVLSLQGGAAGDGGGSRGASVSNNVVPMVRAPTAAERAGGSSGPDPDPNPGSATPLLEVRTSDGRVISARRVLHCTNGWASSLLPELRAALVPVRNQVLATAAPPAGGAPVLPLDAAFYAKRGYIYFSQRDDGRAIVGGFRHVLPDMEWGVCDDASTHAGVSEQLRAYLPQHLGLPPLDVEAEWTGILGFTQDRFPFVGPVPHRRGQFVAAGFSGHGMTRTFTAGRCVAAMLAGDALDPAFPAAWLPAEGRFGASLPAVPGPEALAGAVYTPAPAPHSK